MKDVTFFPYEKADMTDRLADISALDPSGGKSFAAPENWDINSGCKECLGGGGAFASADTFMLLLQAILQEDPKILATNSWKEFFKPQLNEQCTEALHQLLLNDPNMQSFCGMGIPTSGKKNWSFAGLLSEDKYPGWMSEDTVLWGGVPCVKWVSSCAPFLIHGYYNNGGVSSSIARLEFVGLLVLK